MEVEKFSRNYNVRLLKYEDADKVFELCNKNELYYEHCPPMATKESILEDMKALPPGKTIEDKFYIGYFDENELIAVMDFIDSYPEEKTAFIGFFMTDSSIQNRGIGTKIIDELVELLKSQDYKEIRLGWVKGNDQAENFWKKNGFEVIDKVMGKDELEFVMAKKII